MKTIEQGSNRFTTWLGNATALPVEWVHSVLAVHLFFRVTEYWHPRLEVTEWRWLRIAGWNKETQSLFYNAVLFIRLVFPLGVFVQIRWAGRNPAAKEYVQFGFGWKLNGRLAVLFRVQSDQASSKGVSGPNVGQAYGWLDGTK